MPAAVVSRRAASCYSWKSHLTHRVGWPNPSRLTTPPDNRITVDPSSRLLAHPSMNRSSELFAFTMWTFFLSMLLHIIRRLQGRGTATSIESTWSSPLSRPIDHSACRSTSGGSELGNRWSARQPSVDGPVVDAPAHIEWFGQVVFESSIPRTTR